jgi:hypothetical protein
MRVRSSRLNNIQNLSAVKIFDITPPAIKNEREKCYSKKI